MESTLDSWDHNQPYYHGSPLQLHVLHAGSTITQDQELARVFSHKPSLVSQGYGESGKRTFKHSGEIPGFLYRVIEPIGPQDIYPHPRTTMGPGQEWLTNRELQVELISRTEVIEIERLTATELVAMQGRHRARTEAGEP